MSWIPIGSAMFGAIFNLVTCQITVIFGKLKDGSLEINSLVYIKAMVSATETSSKIAQNGVKALSLFIRNQHFNQNNELFGQHLFRGRVGQRETGNRLSLAL